MTAESDIIVIKDALALMLEAKSAEIGGKVYCSVINQHFSTQQEAKDAEDRATEKYRNVITRLKR
jgi:hypothetical protein